MWKVGTNCRYLRIFFVICAARCALGDAYRCVSCACCCVYACVCVVYDLCFACVRTFDFPPFCHTCLHTFLEVSVVVLRAHDLFFGALDLVLY